MEDLEIYAKADKVLQQLSSELTEGIYKSTGGGIVLGWGTVKEFNAWAESRAKGENSPPEHRIVLNYELVRLMYRDAEMFVEFSKTVLKQPNVRAIFDGVSVQPDWSIFATDEDFINNIFVAGITWVYFHELGHLNQEHGKIRGKYSSEPTEVAILEECSSNSNTSLSGKEAAVHHVTEFAADNEATSFCVYELVRHFWQKENQTVRDAELFSITLFSLMVSISCACYRFYAARVKPREAVPEGSHPHPVRRLEAASAQVWEQLDILGGMEESLHRMDRRQLVQLCWSASLSAALFWLWRAGQTDIPDGYTPIPVDADATAQTYWPIIIATWDEIQPDIVRMRHFNGDYMFGMLSFTENFRAKVGCVKKSTTIE